MRVPGIVYASRDLLPDERADKSLVQVADVATLPGIVVASFAMPDVHWGYGFPIGGVAATDVEDGGVVSPGGVGFDISCGVRLLVVHDRERDGVLPVLAAVMDGLDKAVPRGMGRGGVWQVPDRATLRNVLQGGAEYAVRVGHGVARDLDRCEDRGCIVGADTTAVSERAMERGLVQVGSLGSGNHFLEVQAVDEIFDAEAAAAMGLRPGAVCVMIHCGSRGLGHQICTDHVRRMGQAMGLVRGTSWRGLAEEKPEAYKDVDAVAEVSALAGLARKVARLVPLGVVKG
jgi:tRNA-splicing ligase RtcB (3'-phosphate/5'-hydroxy nucleic acid ligase)